MAAAARAMLCEVKARKSGVERGESSKVSFNRVAIRAGDSSGSSSDDQKIVLQPRVCTLRSYGSDRAGLVARNRGEEERVSRFFASLSEYVENSRKTQDFEIISGRLAMLVFAATVTVEVVTGNSLFRKMDLQVLEEAGGVCLGAVVCAALFAWFSSNRSNVGRMFTLGCNAFIDALIDNLIDGLFYNENEISDWSDDP
ncbi:hypothetical protein Scep_018645 [Stephania cephalantha]|uniref:Stress enhanced protein 2 n=1 Tax=Stephania cephalantha TaxID=152367 RepID=A0AAP0I9B1_9MAGN